MLFGNSQRDVCLRNDFSAKMTDLILNIPLVNYTSQANPKHLSFQVCSLSWTWHSHMKHLSSNTLWDLTCGVQIYKAKVNKWSSSHLILPNERRCERVEEIGLIASSNCTSGGLFCLLPACILLLGCRTAAQSWPNKSIRHQIPSSFCGHPGSTTVCKHAPFSFIQYKALIKVPLNRLGQAAHWNFSPCQSQTESAGWTFSALKTGPFWISIEIYPSATLRQMPGVKQESQRKSIN